MWEVLVKKYNDDQILSRLDGTILYHPVELTLSLIQSNKTPDIPLPPDDMCSSIKEIAFSVFLTNACTILIRNDVLEVEEVNELFNGPLDIINEMFRYTHPEVVQMQYEDEGLESILGDEIAARLKERLSMKG